MRKELTVLISGEAGQGVGTVGELLAQILITAGFNFITSQGYHSRIRGGHNTFTIRILEKEKLVGPEERADLVISLNKNSDLIESTALKPKGLLLASSSDMPMAKDTWLNVPYKDLSEARELNIAALGILVGALQLSEEIALEVLNKFFAEIGDSQKALAAFSAGQKWAHENKLSNSFSLKTLTQAEARLLINGNEAISLGAALAGVNFCSFYPMSPATTVALNLAQWAEKAGLVVEQAEDEIAAVNMAIGASYAGAPSIVPTSGGGFALMCEGVSLAAMTETPLVFVVVQRPGPATGLPTRSEQADLNLCLYAGHGEFPRAIFAPGTIEECLKLTEQAVHLAEASQGPVFILSDQYLADSVRPIKAFDLTDFKPPLNSLDIHKRNETALKDGQLYQRYEITDEEGLSPRLLPGFSKHLVKADSDEHTPDGHISEDLSWRVKMQDKRQSKYKYLKSQALEPSWYGSPEAQIILITWGSTYGAGLEAVDELNLKTNAALLHFSQVYPLKPDLYLPKIEKASKVIIVEGNSEGQFAQLLRRECSFVPTQIIKRYDGLPLSAEYILKQLEVD